MLKSSQFFQEPVKRMLRRDRMDLLVTGGQNHRPTSSELLCPGSSHRNLITIMKRLQKPELQQSLPLLSPSLFLIISPQHCTPHLLFGKTGSGPLAPVGLALTVGLSLPQLLAWITTPSLKCVNVEARAHLIVLFLRGHPPCLRQSVTRTWGSLIILVQEASKPQVSAFHCLLSSGITNGCYQALL